MKVKIVLAILFVTVGLGVGLGIYVLVHRINSSSTESATPTPSPSGQAVIPPAGSVVYKTGTMVCLTPKQTDGPQLTICAIGLKGDDGQSYALGSDDPSLTGSVPTGQRAAVTGIFTAQTSTYQSAGLIKVTTLKRL